MSLFLLFGGGGGGGVPVAGFFGEVDGGLRLLFLFPRGVSGLVGWVFVAESPYCGDRRVCFSFLYD